MIRFFHFLFDIWRKRKELLTLYSWTRLLPPGSEIESVDFYCSENFYEEKRFLARPIITLTWFLFNSRVCFTNNGTFAKMKWKRRLDFIAIINQTPHDMTWLLTVKNFCNSFFLLHGRLAVFWIMSLERQLSWIIIIAFFIFIIHHRPTLAFLVLKIEAPYFIRHYNPFSVFQSPAGKIVLFFSYFG